MTFPSNFVVVVTGAGGNLGSAVAKAANRTGARLALIGRAEEKITSLFNELGSTENILPLPGYNLTHPEHVAQSFNQIIAKFGQIDALVNTVGAFRGGQPVHEDSLETWEFLFNVNLRTTLLCCRAAIPHMLEQKNGRIITIGSRNSWKGAAKKAAYGAAKSAVLRLTESLAAELKDAHITANCILPLTIDTPQNRKDMPIADFTSWVAPEAIAQVIMFLISVEGGPITGAAIPV